MSGLNFTSSDPTGKPYPAGFVRCVDTGCVMPEAEAEAHERAVAAKAAHVSLQKVSVGVNALQAVVEDQRAAIGEATAAIAALQAQLAALQAPKKPGTPAKPTEG